MVEDKEPSTGNTVKLQSSVVSYLSKTVYSKTILYNDIVIRKRLLDRTSKNGRTVQQYLIVLLNPREEGINLLTYPQQNKDSLQT